MLKNLIIKRFNTIVTILLNKCLTKKVFFKNNLFAPITQ